MNRAVNTPAPTIGSGSTAFRAPYNPATSSQPLPTPYGPPRTIAGTRNGYPFSAQLLEDSQRQSQIQQHLQQLSLGSQGNAPPSSLTLQSEAPSGTSQNNPDLSDFEFPALGSSAPNNSMSVTTNGTSYASQAQSAQLASGNLNTVSSASTGFGPDDFPKLGQASDVSHSVNGSTNGAPGDTVIQQQQHSILGMVPTQSRSTILSESQKQIQMLRNKPRDVALGLPPGVVMFHQQHMGALAQSTSQQAQQISGQTYTLQPSNQYPDEHNLRSSSRNNNGAVGPQSPAQQVLTSPADRWGLLALLAMIRSVDPDTVMLGMGTDLAHAGFELGAQDNLYSSFITPWSDASAAQNIEPEFHVPSVYNVQPAVPGPNKAASFSDETLFFMFYSAPRDVLQEVAAQELHNRNWRFHKEMRLWLTKESGTPPSQKAPTFERGMYTFFDPATWERVKKDMLIEYDRLEEKAPLSSLPAGNIGGPIPQGPTQQPPPPPGMGILAQGVMQHQQHQHHQLADQFRHRQEMQSMGARTRTPGIM